MAVRTKTITVRTDDLGGAGKAEPQMLTLNGRTIKIDLNKRNAETLERHLSKYFEAGEPVEAKKPNPRVPAVGIRAWAAENGYSVKPNGRVPRDIEVAFFQAKEGAKK